MLNYATKSKDTTYPITDNYQPPFPFIQNQTTYKSDSFIPCNM